MTRSIQHAPDLDLPIPYELTEKALEQIRGALAAGDLRRSRRRGRWTVRLRDLESWRRGNIAAIVVARRSA
ncbi:MAG: hypothetical protein JWO63_1127 [Frankiales bacterium]|nr:hypothetical protein [Frankiales bacterium]